MRQRVLLCVLASAVCLLPAMAQQAPGAKPAKPALRIVGSAPGFKEIHYDHATGRLDLVKEQDGKEVTHYGVPESLYRAFEKSPFKMAFYRANIVGQYRTVPTLRHGGRNMIPVVSKTMDGIWYNAKTQELVVLADSGAATLYKDVPAETFEAFLKAPIKGAYFNGFIKGKFATSPAPELTGEDMDPVIEVKQEPVAPAAPQESAGKIDVTAPAEEGAP